MDEQEDLVEKEELEYVQEDETFNNDEQEPEIEQAATDEEPSEVVEKAKKYGHLSKEDWIAQGRDPKLWKSPEEFNKTGEAIDQLYALKKKVDQRDREIQALIEYQKRTAEREYQKARQELESKLNDSKNDMDIEAVAHYTKELTRLEDTEQRNTQQQQQQAQIQAKQAFIERNQHWFNDRNPDLQQRAVEIDNEIQTAINAGRLPVNSYDDIAAMIEKRLAYEYPERVLGQSHNARPITSQSNVNKTAIVKKTSIKNLSQEHRDTYNVYKRINPKITEAEFIQRLKDDGEI